MRGTHTRLYIHLVWATWNRLPLISPEMEGPLFACMQVEAVELGSQVLAIGGVEDHAHVLVRIPTTVSVSVLVKQMKGASSHLVTHTLNAPGFFKWQGGYGAFTVSSWDVRRVAGYIRRQKEHHRTGTLSATLERIELS